MLEALNDIMTLFAKSFFGSLAVGAVCPLLGVYFILRRMVFLGIAVPQFSAAGVAFGFLVLPAWNCLWADDGCAGHDEGSFCFHLFFAMLFTFGALLVLVWLGRRGGGSTEGRIAAAYALAAAATILFLSGSALGVSHVNVLLKGEILAISDEGFTAILLFFGLALGLFVLFRRDFLLIAYDREAAVSLGKNPFAWDLFLYLLVGAAISVGVLTVGPLVIFGLMVIPPLAARHVAFNMASFYLLSSFFGLITAFGGFVASYMLDWPLGPTDVAAAFVLLLLVWGGKAVRRGLRGPVDRPATRA
jgi:ABC-type Mn2+/Zn2+ transport system permease subunit